MECIHTHRLNDIQREGQQLYLEEPDDVDQKQEEMLLSIPIWYNDGDLRSRLAVSGPPMAPACYPLENLSSAKLADI